MKKTILIVICSFAALIFILIIMFATGYSTQPLDTFSSTNPNILYSSSSFPKELQLSKEKIKYLKTLGKHDYEYKIFFSCGPLSPAYKIEDTIHFTAICSIQRRENNIKHIKQKLACGPGSCPNIPPITSKGYVYTYNLSTKELKRGASYNLNYNNGFSINNKLTKDIKETEYPINSEDRKILSQIPYAQWQFNWSTSFSIVDHYAGVGPVTEGDKRANDFFNEILKTQNK